MRIALALEYPLMQQGGTEVLVQELVRRLSRHFEIVLVSGDKSQSGLPAEFSKLVCARLSWNRETASTANARLLADLMQKEGIHLAHFHFGGTYEWASNRFWRCPVYHLARYGVPCMSTNHLAMEWLNCGVNPSRPTWQKHMYQVLAIASRSMLYRRLKVEVCVSKHDQRRVHRQFPVFKRKIIQLYHSLLSADATPFQLESRQPAVLCVGTIGGRKAQPILAEAFARIATKYPAWRLDLVGRVDRSPDANRIREVTAKHGLTGRLNLLGRLSDEETVNRMRTASIIAMPSLQEGLGLSLQEALFHGCVAVGTRAGGIPELIDDGQNGLLVEPGNVEQLADALERLMADETLRRTMSARARPSILEKGMTVERMVQTYERLYTEIIQTSWQRTI